MCVKKNLRLLRQTYLNLKNLKILYFIPLLFLFIILPFISIGYVISSGREEVTYYKIFAEFQRYIPFMATWWVVFGLKEYAEGDGKEILRVYKKGLIIDFFIIFFWYISHVISLFILYNIFLENYWLDFILISIQSLAFASSTFLFMFAFKTISIPFLINIFYEIFCMYANMNFLKFINILSEPRMDTINDLLIPYCPLLFLSLVFIFYGNAYYKRKAF